LNSFSTAYSTFELLLCEKVVDLVRAHLFTRLQHQPLGLGQKRRPLWRSTRLAEIPLDGFEVLSRRRELVAGLCRPVLAFLDQPFEIGLFGLQSRHVCLGLEQLLFEFRQGRVRDSWGDRRPRLLLQCLVNPFDLGRSGLHGLLVSEGASRMRLGEIEMAPCLPVKSSSWFLSGSSKSWRASIAWILDCTRSRVRVGLAATGGLRGVVDRAWPAASARSTLMTTNHIIMVVTDSAHRPQCMGSLSVAME
jgi:hypothetical protein